MGHPQNVLVVLFMALLSGAVLTFVLSRYLPDAPYTVAVFAAGLILAAIFGEGTTSGIINGSLVSWEHIDPELILYVFLPALLFGEAMTLNFHHVKGALSNGLLLAGPGAIFSSFAIAGMARWLFSYGWSWHLCFLFGTILCTTDTVAVVALLKKVGASNRLTYMIMGEALLNDGTALVLFNVLHAVVQHHAHFDATPLNIFLYFLKVIVTSPLLGIAFGAISLFLMSIATRRMKEEDNTIQMAITLTCAYVSFYVGEYVCHISGVLCCVTAATVLARFASPLVLRPETLHSVWHAIEWIGNTVIFFLAGIIITLRSTTVITPLDVGYLLFTYVGVLVLRALMLTLFLPVMQRLGKGCSPKEALFMSWGGLRGAVSIALALLLVEWAESGEISVSAHDAHRVLFLVGGTAALSLMINATTAGTVLKKLGLLLKSANEEGTIMFHYAKKSIRLKAFKLLDQIQKEHPELIDPDYVIERCSIMHDLEESAKKPKPARRRSTLDISIFSTAKPFVPLQADPMAIPDIEEGKNEDDDEEGDDDDEGEGDDNKAKEGEADEAAGEAAEGEEGGSKKVPARPIQADVVRRMLHRAESLVTPMSAAHDDYNHQLTDAISSIANTRERGRTIFEDSRKIYRGMSIRHEDMQELTKLAQVNLTAEARTDDIRRAFLNVVRVRYWRQISTGRLPRKSGVALTLLNSIDVALEETDLPGLADWQFILISKAYLFEDVLQAYKDSDHRIQVKPRAKQQRPAGGPSEPNQFDVILARHTDSAVSLLSIDLPEDMKRRQTGAVSRRVQCERILREYNCKQAVYLLISFIEAQGYAQRKIPFYLGEDLSTTPEAALVIRESIEEVDHATRLLQHIHPKIARRQLSKLAVRWILHMQEDAIETFQNEGVITEEQAEELFDETADDLLALRQSKWYRLVFYQLNHFAYTTMDKIAAMFTSGPDEKS